MALSSLASRTLETLNFDNQTLRRLPLDADESVATRHVRGACFSRIKPPGLANPTVVAVADEALSLLDLAPAEASRPEFAQYFSGSAILPGSEPAAHCYCGHQFGNFAGQLGDGAAMYLGEVVNSRGERWELQIKGAGPTPYSRDGDGHKVLRSSIREFLCSEAMHHLGIPTTRAGSVVTSDSRVVRDMFYDGRPRRERVTVVSRIAPTFLRFGSFEIFKPTDSATGRAGPSAGLEQQLLPTMLDFTIQQYYPHLWAAYALPPPAPPSAPPPPVAAAAAEDGDAEGAAKRKRAMYRDFFREVVRRTASLAALWQSVGFCHGVLNTDNMSIVGLTIDYGPFGFMQRHDPDFICNTSDDSGRYDYRKQPAMCRWNCVKLGEALRSLLPLEASREELPQFDAQYDATYLQVMRRKLGLLKAVAGKDDEDRALVAALLDTMHVTGTDFTSTFRRLSAFPTPPPSPPGGVPAGHEYADGGLLEELLGGCCSVQELLEGMEPRIPLQQLQMLELLAHREPNLLHSLGVNPQMVKQELEKQDRAADLRKVTPDEKAAADRQRWVAWLQRYGRRLQAEADAGAGQDERVVVMLATNPRLVLHNWMAQAAIDRAEAGSYAEVGALLEALRHPFDDSHPLPAFLLEHAGPASGAAVAPEGQAPAAGGGPTCLRPPSWASGLKVSCSS